VLPVELPALRRRTEDIPLLAEHFLRKVAMREGGEPKRFDDEAVDLLKQYDWPGNVRELENICERASVLSGGPVIDAPLIQPWLGSGEAAAPSASAEPMFDDAHEADRGATATAIAPTAAAIEPRKLEDVERDQIITALQYYAGNRQRTAEALGIGVRTLGLKLKKWKEQNLVAQSL